MITSRDNALIKKIISLHRTAGRKKRGQYFIEGIRSVKQALDAGAPVAQIIYSAPVYEQRGGQNLMQRIRQLGLRVMEISESLFKVVTDTKSPQYIMAVINMKVDSPEKVLEAREPLIVIADSIQDPGNLGTVIRTADAAGAEGVFLLRGSTDPYSPKVVRSTMGSVFNIPIIRENNESDLLSLLHRKGMRIITAEPGGDNRYWDADFKGKVGIVIGNEANGISPRAKKYSHESVALPMYGKAESLNAAVTCGVLLYKALEQRLT